MSYFVKLYPIEGKNKPHLTVKVVDSWYNVERSSDFVSGFIMMKNKKDQDFVFDVHDTLNKLDREFKVSFPSKSNGGYYKVVSLLTTLDDRGVRIEITLEKCVR